MGYKPGPQYKKILDELLSATLDGKIRDRNDAEAGEFKIKAWAASGMDPKIWGFALIFL